MKSPAGQQPRARRRVQRPQVQLNLRRTPTWPEEDELDEPPGTFWKWFAAVLLAHVVILVVLLVIFHAVSPKPPMEFISLVPAGGLAKGTPGAQAAHKISPTTPAPNHPAAPVPPPPTPVPEKPKIHHVIPPPPKPPPILKDDATEQAPPVKPPPPKVAKIEPAKPKIKIDLSQLVDAPDTDEPPPKIKPKPHPKKVVHHTHDTPDRDTTESDTDGLSPAEVARKLGDKLKAEGVEQGKTSGPSGETNAASSDFSGYYGSIREQVLNKWSVPNIVDATAIDPIVRIHVEKDGRVPPERVKLQRSSGNPALDQSALEAARTMGYTLQPLPDGCPPDISITFNLHQ